MTGPEKLECFESLARHLRLLTGLEINLPTVIAACKASDEELADRYGPPQPDEFDVAEDELFSAALDWDRLETQENTETLHACARKYRTLLKSYVKGK